MSAIDTEIVQAFESLRGFCREVARLLQTTDALMLKAGWNQALKNQVMDFQTTTPAFFAE